MTVEGLTRREGAVLVVIDVQEKLFPYIEEKERIARNIEKLIHFAQLIKMPIILTEQYPKGLGPTISRIQKLLKKVKAIQKVSFNCLGSTEFKESLLRLEARTLIIVGIEAHVCVTQTALESLSRGYRVCIVRDAISSRRLDDKSAGLERMKQNGAIIVSTEMIIYELLEKAGTQEFKEALKLVR